MAKLNKVEKDLLDQLVKKKVTAAALFHNLSPSHHSFTVTLY